MLSKILGGLLVVVIVIIGCAYVLPRNVHVERSVVVARPAEAVFPYLNSFHHFNEWSPWAALDPNAQMTYSGAKEGVGAKLAWAGNDKVGRGSQVITESVPYSRVASDLDFGADGTAKAAFSLMSDGTGTRVTWSVDVDVGNSPVGRYMGLYIKRDVGADYERGLTKLQTVVEQAPPTALEDQPASAPATSANAPTS